MASIVTLLEGSARAWPDDVALCYRGREYSYGEVRRRVDALAGALAGLGVEQGDCVAVVAANSNASVEALFACARLGAVCERHNVRLSPRVIAQLLARSEARVVLVSGAMLEALAGCLDEVGRSVAFVLVDEPDGGAACEPAEGVPRYEELLAAAEPVSEGCVVDDADPAMLLYTSGTTGMPCGVLLSHGALLKRVAIDIEGMRFSHDDVMLCVLPLFHVTFVSTLATLALGARLVIADARKPADIAADIVRVGATRTALVPYLMRGLADHVAREGVDLGTLELIIYGGEPVEPELLEHCRRLLPCGLLQGYGMTETTAAITMLLPEHHARPELLSTVGTAVAGMELKIVDDAGGACPAGVPGEVLVRTDTLMIGYHRDPERTAEVMRDGWYCTGDIGVLDGEGFLTLVDRKNNLVITGGENVYPLEVSRCVRALEGVVDAAVVGVPDARWGESLAAFVVRAEGARVSEADVVAHCARELGGYKKPRAVRFVEDLGRSASGKISRDRLEELKRLL